MKKSLDKIEEKVLGGEYICFDEAMELTEIEGIEDLFAAANRIRERFKGKKTDLCTIMNAKSGRCSENCKYCAQSGHYNTGITDYPLVSIEDVLKLAKENEACGVKRFSLVTSGRTVSEEELEKLIEIFKVLKQETSLSLCASLGCISYRHALKLKEAGVEMYHHNVETSSDYFDKICDTHSYQDRVDTIKNVISAGLKVCSGGIIGMGESLQQRIRMAFEVRELGVKSIPINILFPLKGTPMENVQKLAPEDVLKTFAIFRFIIPDATIRYAGGRASLGNFQRVGLKAGIDGVMLGNYLTTTGNEIYKDLKMIEELDLEI